MRFEAGPDATVRATAEAWRRVDGARAVVLVEGVSDQAAVEAAARAGGRDLERERVVVLPVGGAQAIGGRLRELVGRDRPLRIGGLYDAAEGRHVRRALAASGLGGPADGDDLAGWGFFVCVEDLEDELVRAAGRALVEQVIDAEGDRRAFETMREQPAWRGAPFEAQVRRFIGAGARRKLRYAWALVEALPPGRVPAPLAAVLDAVG